MHGGCPTCCKHTNHTQPKPFKEVPCSLTFASTPTILNQDLSKGVLVPLLLQVRQPYSTKTCQRVSLFPCFCKYTNHTQPKPFKGFPCSLTFASAPTILNPNLSKGVLVPLLLQVHQPYSTKTFQNVSLFPCFCKYTNHTQPKPFKGFPCSLAFASAPTILNQNLSNGFLVPLLLQVHQPYSTQTFQRVSLFPCFCKCTNHTQPIPFKGFPCSLAFAGTPTILNQNLSKDFLVPLLLQVHQPYSTKTCQRVSLFPYFCKCTNHTQQKPFKGFRCSLTFVSAPTILSQNHSRGFLVPLLLQVHQPYSTKTFQGVSLFPCFCKYTNHTQPKPFKGVPCSLSFASAPTNHTQPTPFKGIPCSLTFASTPSILHQNLSKGFLVPLLLQVHQPYSSKTFQRVSLFPYFCKYTNHTQPKPFKGFPCSLAFASTPTILNQNLSKGVLVPLLLQVRQPYSTKTFQRVSLFPCFCKYTNHTQPKPFKGFPCSLTFASAPTILNPNLSKGVLVPLLLQVHQPYSTKTFQRVSLFPCFCKYTNHTQPKPFKGFPCSLAFASAPTILNQNLSKGFLVPLLLQVHQPYSTQTFQRVSLFPCFCKYTNHTQPKPFKGFPCSLTFASAPTILNKNLSKGFVVPLLL